jgi:tRNA pseudouridine38-40 synthase
MQRYFLELSFDGTAYHGWQIQANANGVQGEVNKALSTVLQTECFVTGAGRTDTGVHALQMFCHFDADLKKNDPDKLIYQLNSILPSDIAIKAIMEVKAEANCRFDASSRTYIYKIIQEKNPFYINKAWYHPFALDLDAMNRACDLLITYRNFTSFSKTGSEVKTDICDLMDARWTKSDGIVLFNITADRFLRNMVRAIVGTMVEIGSGKMDLAAFKNVIESLDRSKAGFSAPASGLYLKSITYPYKLISLSNV